MRWRFEIALVLLALACLPGMAAAKSALPGCDAFVEKLRLAANGMQVEFTHSLVVSRARADVNVFDITTNVEVDATLTCHGDEFVRFESRLAEPASSRGATNFDRFSAAALRVAMNWDETKGAATLRGMTNDVREYLAASRERGDTFVSGKTEEHAPGGISLGLIYSDTDRAFIIVGPDG